MEKLHHKFDLLQNSIEELVRALEIDIKQRTNTQITNVTHKAGAGILAVCATLSALCCVLMMLAVSVLWTAGHAHNRDIASYERTLENMDDDLKNREIRIRKLNEQLENQNG